jgi:hypothetical protein
MYGSNSGQPTEPVPPLERTCGPALRTAQPLATGQVPAIVQPQATALALATEQTRATGQAPATGHKPAKAVAKDSRKREEAVRGSRPTEVAAEARLPGRPVADVMQAPRAGPVLQLVQVALTDGPHLEAEAMEGAVASRAPAVAFVRAASVVVVASEVEAAAFVVAVEASVAAVGDARTLRSSAMSRLSATSRMALVSTASAISIVTGFMSA